MNTPNQILEGTTAQIQKLIGQILEIEEEFKNKKNIHQDKALEKHIGERICKVIEKEVIE